MSMFRAWRHIIDYGNAQSVSISVFCKCSKFCGEREVSSVYLAIYFTTGCIFIALFTSQRPRKHTFADLAYNFHEFADKFARFSIGTLGHTISGPAHAFYTMHTIGDTSLAQRKTFKNIKPTADIPPFCREYLQEIVCEPRIVSMQVMRCQWLIMLIFVMIWRF